MPSGFSLSSFVSFNLKGTDMQEKQRSFICRFTSQNACTSQGCAKPKPGVWNNLALPHEQQQAAGTGSWAETVFWNAGILSGILNAAQMITPKLRVIYHLLPPFSRSLLTSKWIAFAVRFSQIQVRLSNPWNTPDEVGIQRYNRQGNVSFLKHLETKIK